MAICVFAQSQDLNKLLVLLKSIIFNSVEPKDTLNFASNDEIQETYINYIKSCINCEENNNIIEKEGKGESKYILEEFLEDKNILKNKEKLIAFMEELKVILKSGNNCIIPFLDLCPILIKEYIESDLDEEGGNSELKYIEICIGGSPLLVCLESGLICIHADAFANRGRWVNITLTHQVKH